ncbi:MAG TPA: peptide MFS transporter [Allosphingosinicella sp.]|uniref:peptide MFS transporter n=1 Tax=Allosphingosinicella sp. TaxID=2823234 RepID=UPI002ED8ED23
MSLAEATPELDIADRDARNDRAFFGHPKGLGYLAFTETWERFSYYGMQTLLVLYMVNELLLPGHIENVVGFESLRGLYGNIEGQALASAIFGTYTSLVYLTPILGGLLADRVLGKRRTVMLGAITMAAGHFMMAFEASFLFALLFLIIGNGMFKGNIASQVGALYGPDDLRRASAFQIFFLGINAAVIASPLVVGTLGEGVGWHWGFGAAGVGMLIGLVIYIAGQKHLPKEHFDRRAAGEKAERPKLTRTDWSALIALFLLIPVMAVGFLPNQQIFNAYLVWGDRQFDLEFMGTQLPTSWLITLDAITSVSFLALVALFYAWYGKRRKEPDEVTKMIIGSVFVVGGLLCLFVAAATTPEGEKIGLFWPVMFHLLNSIGFAHMLPVSLALFAKVAPKAVNATVIGIYYLTFVAANAMVGYVGGWLDTMPTTSFWLMHAGFAAVAGFVFLLFKIFLSKRLVQAEPAPLPD